MPMPRRIQTCAAAVLLCGGGAVGALLLTTNQSHAQQAKESAAEPVKWEYTIVRLEGPEPRHRDASLALLRSYGAQGWEAVELLPPAYDILMKRPVSR